MIIFCESSDDFNSKDYKGYKPYTMPRRGYDWREYVRLNDTEDGVVSCHMCDNGKIIDLMRYSSNCKMNYQIRLDFFLHLDKKESFHLSRIKSKELGYIKS